MADPSGFSDELASSSSYRTAIPRSLSPQSDLVSLSSTSDSEDQCLQSASQEDSDVTEAVTNTRPPELREVLVPQATGTISDIPSADRNGQGQSTEQPLSSVSLHSASSSEQSGSGMMMQAASSSTPTQYGALDSSNLRVCDYESTGLLYARATKARDNM